MTEEFANKIYNYIRSYYNFYISRKQFCDTYIHEFDFCPDNIVFDGIKHFCTCGYNKNPPTITDVKEYILRKKWIYEYRLRSARYDEVITPEEEKRLCKAIAILHKGLNGFGEEYEIGEDRAEYEVGFKSPTRPKYTDEEMEQFERDFDEMIKDMF